VPHLEWPTTVTDDVPSFERAKSSIPGLVTGKPNMSFYVKWDSRKEGRVEWKEEKKSASARRENLTDLLR
jgi:hypothetical protein